MEIDKFSFVIGHGHKQHAGAGRREHHSLRYHKYLILEGCDLNDGFSFLNSYSLMRMTGPKLLSVHFDDEPMEEVQTK